MKAQDIRTKTEQEVKEELVKLNKQLEEVTLNILQKKEKNVKKTRSIRRDIARLKTVVNEKKFKVSGVLK